MAYLLSFLAAILALNVRAQEGASFNFLEASKAYNKGIAELAKINGNHVVAQDTPCTPLKNSEGEAVMSCNVRKSDIDNSVIFKVDYTSKNFPILIKNQLSEKFIEQINGKNVSCVFQMNLMNDNQQMLGRRAEQHVKNASYGDDFYRTHGLSIGVNCISEDGVASAFTYSTDLYSDPDRLSAAREADGNVRMRQKFTSENIFSLVQDNINENQVTYWKRGVGFINLSEKKKWGLLQSTGQQEWFHGKLNDIKAGYAYQFENIDGERDRWTPFVMLGMGLQMNRQFGDRCKINFRSDAGVRVADVEQSTLNANASAKLSYQVLSNGYVYLSAEEQVTKRTSSAIAETSLNVGVETSQRSFFQIGVSKQGGNRKDVPDKANVYTGKNDLLISVKIGYAY